MYNGIINIYKEAGFTSHDVVAKMRGILKQKKIGHTGTLDPEAVGVLPVCLGSGTKLCEVLTDHSKEYEAVLLLGVSTDTQDTTGTVLSEKEVNCTVAQATEAVLSFVGEYDQIPPMYSALKVDGKKLYELARAGREVERAARRVVIENIVIEKIEFPRIVMRVSCSKGTYIRTLCHDIGEKLGCGGAMEKLTRKRVGQFQIEEAITLAQLEKLRDENRVEEKILTVDGFFHELPPVHIKEEFTKLIENGNAFGRQHGVEWQKWEAGERIRVYDRKNQFYGVYEWDGEKGRMKPWKMFLNEKG